MDDNFFLGNPALSTVKYVSTQWNPYSQQSLGVVDRQGSVSYYRPLAHIVLDYSYAIFKNNLWQYHFLNIFLLALAASLIYLLIRNISGNFNLAFLTGLFYLIHPINGIMVNYISACVFALQVICMLGTILLLWASLENKNDRALYFLSVLFAFLSLFWHESGIMVPFYVSAVILIFRDGPFKKKALYLVPFFLVILSYIIFRNMFFGTNGHVLEIMSIFHMTFWEHLATTFRLIMWYMAKLFCPQGILMQWSMPVLREHIFWDNLGALILLVLFMLVFTKFVKEKIVKLALIFLCIGFAPVYVASFAAPNVGALIEPHWFVFSSIGFFMLAAYMLLFILDHKKEFGLALLFVLIFTWGAVSHAYNQIWANQATYARYWSQLVPNFKLPYFYLADAYQDQGDYKEARKNYRLALMGDPSDMIIYNNLGVMDTQEGHWKNAESNYIKVLNINPFAASAYSNLGYIYFSQGQLKKAEDLFSRAVILNPLQTQFRLNLARVLLKESKYQKAIGLCLKNLDIAENDTGTLFMLVDIYFYKKDLVNLRKYAYCIINSDSNPVVLMKLAIMMARWNINDAAIESYIKIMRMAPDNKEAYLGAGELLGNLGQYEQAIHLWKLGSGIDPLDRRFKLEIDKAERLKSKK